MKKKKRYKMNISLDIKLGPYDNRFEMIWPANSWVIVHDQKSFVDRPFQSKKKKN